MPKPSRKKALRHLLDELHLVDVDEAAWFLLRDRLVPITESQLRRALRELGVPVAAPYGGVNQADLEELEHSLRELADVYGQLRAAGDERKARLCRKVVIEAKDHARMASCNQRVPDERRRLKAEMVDWMLVWLESPDVFGPWAALRRKRLAEPHG